MKSQDFKLRPECLDTQRLHFVGADGVYYPCCHTRAARGRADLRNLLGGSLDDLSLKRHRTRKNVLNSAAWRTLLNSFTKAPMETCITQCGAKKTAAWGVHDGVNSAKAFGQNGTQRRRPFWSFLFKSR